MKRFAIVWWLLFLVTSAYATDFEDMKLAAENGDHAAQLIVGLSYYFGEYRDGSPVPKDDDLAVKWLTNAAQGGDSYSQFHLAGMYHDGLGVETDKRLAAKWYLESAKRGNTKARTNIAEYYFYGTGIEQDFEEAYAWATLASYQGNENAEILVSKVIAELVDREKADAKAVEYFEKYGAIDPHENRNE